eukprot:COSAG05_NODE_1532_length_4620_cov_2.450564_3_plen_41_part_00
MAYKAPLDASRAQLSNEHTQAVSRRRYGRSVTMFAENEHV